MKKSILLLLPLIMLAGCLGTSAREKILLPSLQAVWPAVRIDAVAGGADSSILSEFDAAMATGDRTILQSLWLVVQPAAVAGSTEPIALQPSKLERINNFSLALSAYAQGRGGGR